MANPAALVEALNSFDQNNVRVTLQAIGDTVGWEPPSGNWEPDDIIGPPGEPTPILEALTLTLHRGWRLEPANDQAGAIDFVREAPAKVSPFQRLQQAYSPVAEATRLDQGLEREDGPEPLGQGDMSEPEPAPVEAAAPEPEVFEPTPDPVAAEAPAQEIETPIQPPVPVETDAPPPVHEAIAPPAPEVLPPEPRPTAGADPESSGPASPEPTEAPEIHPPDQPGPTAA